MRKIGFVGLVLVVGFLFLAGDVWAEEIAVPAAINYQGKLTNPSDGNPVQAGVYHLEFRVWNDPVDTAEANLIWGRVFSVHVMDTGVFNILLTDDGTAVTAPAAQTNDLKQAFQGENRYLGLTITHGPTGVIDSPEISPRQRMVSSPFAFHAQNATDAYHAEHADEAVLAQNSEKLGGKSANQYYDYDKFNSIGLSSTYKTLLGWTDGGGAYMTDLYDYWGSFCMTSGNPVHPDSGIKFLIQGGLLQVDDGILAYGPIIPVVGDDSGIKFPDNIGGGTGDAAGLAYFAHENSEDCELRLYVGNDLGDKLRIEASGNIEINAGESLILKNTKRVEVLSGSVHGYSMDKWYKATGDGMVSFWGYSGNMNYYHKLPSGIYLTRRNPQNLNYWTYFFHETNSDAMSMMMLVGKDDEIYFQKGSNHPDQWEIRWRGFGDAVLVAQ